MSRYDDEYDDDDYDDDYDDRPRRRKGRRRRRSGCNCFGCVFVPIVLIGLMFALGAMVFNGMTEAERTRARELWTEVSGRLWQSVPKNRQDWEARIAQLQKSIDEGQEKIREIKASIEAKSEDLKGHATDVRDRAQKSLEELNAARVRLERMLTDLEKQRAEAADVLAKIPDATDAVSSGTNAVRRIVSDTQEKVTSAGNELRKNAEPQQ